MDTVNFLKGCELFPGGNVHQTLITVAELPHPTERLGWRSIDCRADLANPAAGRQAYATGHLPGAFHADLEIDLSGSRIEGVSGRHPLPDRDTLRELFGAWQIRPDTQIVCYDQGNGMFAARCWWLARWLGHPQTAVLDGGLDAWQAASGVLSRDTPERGSEPYPEREPLTRTVSADVLMTDDPQRLLIDARSHARYAGDEEPIDPIAGHIPGAVCYPCAGNLSTDSRFKSRAELRARFEALVGREEDTVCYCGSGVTATHNILALRHAGFAETALYPGSWSEWIQDPERPIESSALPC